MDEFTSVKMLEIEQRFGGDGMASRDEVGSRLNLSVELVPEGKRNRSGRSMIPDYITVHNTSNPRKGADADAHSRFVRNTGYYMLSGQKNWVSWHYTVDDVKVIKQLPINERGIHAGSGNRRSIAIETCMHEGIDQDAANERLANLVAVLMYDLDIQTDRVVPHKHWTGKKCPVLLLAEWDAFVARISEIHSSMIAERVDAPQLIAQSDIALNEEALELDITKEKELPEELGEIDHDLIAQALNEEGAG